MSSSGSTIKKPSDWPNSRPNCTHKSVVIGITMPKSSQSVLRHLVTSSTSPGYHSKVPYWARNPKNQKIGQIRKMTKFPKGSRIARKLSWMSWHASHEVLQHKSPSQDQKPRYYPSAESSRNSQAPLPWAYLSSKVQIPKSTNKGIKKNVRLRKNPTTQNLNNLQYIHRRTLIDGSHGLFWTRPLKRQTILKINIQISWYFHISYE